MEEPEGTVQCPAILFASLPRPLQRGRNISEKLHGHLLGQLGFEVLLALFSRNLFSLKATWLNLAI